MDQHPYPAEEATVSICLVLLTVTYGIYFFFGSSKQMSVFNARLGRRDFSCWLLFQRQIISVAIQQPEIRQFYSETANI